MTELESDMAKKQSEIDSLFQDVDGVYQSNGKSIEAQKRLETQLSQQEEKLINMGKQEHQSRQELNDKNARLDELERNGSLSNERIMRLEELKSANESVLAEQEERLTMVDKELSLKDQLLSELKLITNSATQQEH